MKDQHVQLTIEVNGTGKVAFATDFGWADKLSISLDMTSLSAAKEAVKAFLKALLPVPAFNDADNQGYVEEAKEVLLHLQDNLDEITDIESAGTSAGYPFEISIKFEETYLVEFGE